MNKRTIIRGKAEGDKVDINVRKKRKRPNYHIQVD